MTDSELISLYNNGLKKTEIAKICGMSYGTLKYRFRKLGFSESKEVSISHEDIEKMEKLRSAGMTCREIAKRYNVSTSYIYNRLRDKERERDDNIVVDNGKVFALYRAHWSIRAIAYDMAITENQVIRSLKEMRLI